jgi:adenine-specific DNA-methyltransferase
MSDNEAPVKIKPKKFKINNPNETKINNPNETKINNPNETKIEKNKIYNIDCIEYLKKMDKEIIDEIILDPPYFNVVNEKWDRQWKSLIEYLDWINTIIIELERVSKYSCSFWIFGYAYQLSYIIPIIEKHNFTYRQHIVLDKGLRSVAGRTSSKLKMFPTATEYIVYFHKESRPLLKQFLQNKQLEKKIKSGDINKHLGKAINGGGTWSTIAGKKQQNIQYPTKEDWDKLQELFGEFDIKYDDYVYKFNIETKLTDVWNDINFYDKTYKKYHPTQKPYKLIERLIKASSNANDNILDIFMGSGMTAKVSKDLSRNFWGCELDQKYFENNLITE